MPLQLASKPRIGPHARKNRASKNARPSGIQRARTAPHNSSSSSNNNYPNNQNNRHHEGNYIAGPLSANFKDERDVQQGKIRYGIIFNSPSLMRRNMVAMASTNNRRTEYVKNNNNNLHKRVIAGRESSVTSCFSNDLPETPASGKSLPKMKNRTPTRKPFPEKSDHKSGSFSLFSNKNLGDKKVNLKSSSVSASCSPTCSPIKSITNEISSFIKSFSRDEFNGVPKIYKSPKISKENHRKIPLIRSYPYGYPMVHGIGGF